MRKLITSLLLPAVLCSLGLLSVMLLADSPKASAAYNSAYLISDSNFTDTGTMSAADIQNFLVAKNSGLKNYYAVEDCGSSGGAHYSYYATYYSCGQSVLASKIIYDTGRAYGINPRVILATLQKEQSLITTPNPTASQLNCAMGYYSCSGYVGFFSQVDNGTWQFKTYIELMSGRNWWGYTPASYPCKNASSLYSPGLYPGSDVTFYDHEGHPYTHFVIANTATAAMYCYTPHVYPGSSTHYYSGSYNFVYWYETWFGPTSAGCYNPGNVAGAPSGARVLSYEYSVSRPANLAYVPLNNTGSGCVEAHIWKPGYQSWLANIATGMKSTDPRYGTVVAMNYPEDSRDGLTYIAYSGTGGKAEVHKTSRNLQTFPGFYDVATNLGGVTSSSGQFVPGNFFGRGYDQLAYVLYAGSSGRVEVHMFDTSLRNAIGYYDVATNLGSTSATNGTFVAGDFLGRGYDQMAYILYSNATGRAEVHLFDPTLRTAVGFYDVATDLTGVTASSGTFVAGDFLNRGYDQMAYVIYNGNSGRVEIHTFTPDLRRAIGFQDIPTSLPSFNPN